MRDVIIEYIAIQLTYMDDDKFNGYRTAFEENNRELLRAWFTARDLRRDAVERTRFIIKHLVGSPEDLFSVAKLIAENEKWKIECYGGGYIEKYVNETESEVV